MKEVIKKRKELAIAAKEDLDKAIATMKECGCELNAFDAERISHNLNNLAYDLELAENMPPNAKELSTLTANGLADAAEQYRTRISIHIPAAKLVFKIYLQQAQQAS